VGFRDQENESSSIVKHEEFVA